MSNDEYREPTEEVKQNDEPLNDYATNNARIAPPLEGISAIAARDYLSARINIHPVPTRTKKPLYDWPKYKTDPKKLNKTYPHRTNIGVKLGSPSMGLCDIDLDWPEARLIGDMIVPELPSFGRSSSRCSHRLLYIKDLTKVEPFSVPQAASETLGLNPHDPHALGVVELRGTGGQTIFPPGIHETGQEIEWAKGDTLTNLEEARKHVYTFEQAKRKAGLIATLAVILRYYPQGAGYRNSYTMALSGALVKAGYDEIDVKDWIEQIAELAKDDEANKRGNAGRTANRIYDGDRVTGLRTACELVGIEKLYPTLRKWLAAPKDDNQLKIEALAKLSLFDYDKIAKDEAKKLDLSMKVLSSYVSIERQRQQAMVDPDHMMEPEEAVEFMNTRHAVIKEIGSRTKILSYSYSPTYEKELPVFQSKGDILLSYQNRNVIGTKLTVPEYWLEAQGRGEYQTVFFDPSLPPVHEGMLNLWQGFDITPKEGNWNAMKEHIHMIICDGNEEYYKYVLDWMAWKVYHPGDRPGIVPVYKGPKGTGKSLLGNEYRKLWGQHGLRLYNREHLVGKFNGHFQNAAYALSDEAYFAGDLKAESTLKALVTDDTIAIENKGINVYLAKNCLGIMMTTNEDWAVPATEGERRFVVFQVRNTYGRGQMDDDKRQAYFDPLLDQMNKGGRQAMLYDLLERGKTLGNFHPQYNAPDTEGTREQVYRGLKLYQQLVLDALKRGCLPGHESGTYNTVTATDFITSQPGYYDNPKLLQGGEGTAISIGRLFGDLGAEKNVRNGYSHWAFPSLSETRGKWDKMFGRYTWPNPTSEWREDDFSRC